MKNLYDIESLAKKFISGEDVSLKCANALEVAIDDAFPDDEEMQAVVLMLASYRPGGGDYLYNERDVRKILMKVINRSVSGN
ncbi:hypothetical protein [Paracidovorax konjaci]|uniref:hypothetical protein n=1 Tax=Paracidovorax konjaci TaxID=32040 RepID=UPI00111372F0|nr:hypothetical protein [Paracidovorax konjaci]